MATSTIIDNNDPASNITPDQQKPSGGIISTAQLNTPGAPTFVDYNGQQVATGQKWMETLQNSADTYNKAAGTSMTAQEYDQMLNPSTYGARWGIPETAAQPKPGTTTTPGGVGTQLAASVYAPAAYTPATLGDPTKWEITKDQTVAGQMQNLIDPNSPYYQQWQTAGLQAAAARGLQNSSIAQTGILDSVMRGATPIATADAATYAKAAGYNADEKNQFTLANQNALNSAGAFNAGQANSLASTKYTADKSASTQLSVTDKNNQTALTQSGISAETQKTIAQMNNQSQAAVSAAHDANANLIQSNQQAQAAYNSYVAAVAQIDQNKDMDASAKATAIARQTQIFNAAVAGLKSQIGNTSDIGSPLDISGVSTAANQVGGIDVSSLLNFGS